MKSFKSHLINICSILFGILLSLPLNAQENETKSIMTDDQNISIAKLSADDYAKLVLPPLSLLMESAANSPRIKALMAVKEQELGSLKTTKRNILSTISGFGNYQYGNYASFMASTSSIGGSTGATAMVSNQEQATYSAGGGISIPLDVIYDRKNKIRTQQAKVKQTDYEIQSAIDELKMEIAELYSAAVQQLVVLKAKSEVYTLSNSEMKMGEIQYLNGEITIGQLNSLKTIQAEAIENYESTRAELNKSLLFLEIKTGVKIIKK